MLAGGWGRWAAALVAVALLGGVAAPAAAAKKHKKALTKGESLYFAGNYEDALFILEELSADDKAPAKTRVEALKLTAFCYFLVNAKDQARDAWLRLLAVVPSFKLDPVMESPEFVTFFSAIEPPPPSAESEGESKGEGGAADGEEAAGEAIEAAPGEGADQENWKEEAEVAERGCGIVLCLIPGGVGQYANGHIVKGVIFTVLEVAFLATNIGLWAANEADITGYDSDNLPIYADLQVAQDRYVAQIVFFALAVVTPIIGIIDAFVFWD